MPVRCMITLSTTEKLGALNFIVVPRIGETILIPPHDGNDHPTFYKVMLIQHVPYNIGATEPVVDLLVEARV